MTSKIDFKKKHKSLYSASAKKPGVVEVPEFKYLMVDGEGDPNSSPDFQCAVQTLFQLSYKIKFHIKKETSSPDYTVMPLEGLWWMENMKLFSIENKHLWQWTIMIMQPDFITTDIFHKVYGDLESKGKITLPLDEITFDSYCDGLSAQILHVGPVANEGPTIEVLHQFIDNNGYQRSGKHREIYLSDFRRSKPENLKTIIRQPVSIKSK